MSILTPKQFDDKFPPEKYDHAAAAKRLLRHIERRLSRGHKSINTTAFSDETRQIVENELLKYGWTIRWGKKFGDNSYLFRANKK